MVRQSLDEVQLKVAFQPLVELATGKLFAYEALVRPTHEQFNNPPKLFAEAIRRDCVGELGRLIRQMAIQGCSDRPLFLNVHPKELDDGWLTRPDDPIFSHDQPIFLEITESVPMSKESYAMGTLREVRSKGVWLVVDDLGAGYSNLKYIADLEPAVVKLDRELICEIAKSQRLFKLVRSIVALCVDLGSKVVAEGIETVEELNAAREAGAHYGQGYYIARPDFTPPVPREIVRTSLPIDITEGDFASS
ncbi:MAG: EAL domain-containing protein [Deltaproteobacteria bacterium]|nr:EAL domain-containing protein [Deltaproteobacteria bacterium]